MASAATNRARTSTAGVPVAMHLGSFSRLDIADFDSKGRYPTTPSPQEIRQVPVVTNAWFPGGATALASPLNLTNTQQEDLIDDANVNNLSNDQLTSPDGDQPNDGQSAGIPTAQDPLKQGSRGSGDSGSQPNVNSSSRPFADGLQDPARASLPPGPRHPQAPSRVNPTSQSGPSQQAQRTGSKPPGPYPYSPATTAKPLVTSSPNQLIPTSLNYGVTLQVQNAPRAQMPPPPEEVCIECMMRDRDMADVIVTGPGVWDRESDVHFRDLLEREDDEERAWRERHAAELAVPGTKLRPPRRASKGNRLTEQNLKLWLSMNPKEAHARLMTIDSYIRQQATLLVIEAEARAKAQQEARQVDARIRQSTHESILDDSKSGARIPAPRSSVYSGSTAIPGDEYGHQRDVTMLENGMIVERVNVKREEKERKKEEKKSGKASILSFSSTRDYVAPMTPSGGQMEFVGSGSDYESPYATMSSPSLRPKSAPLGVPLSYTAHSSVDGKNARFMGSKHWQTAWNSGASQAPTGSMMDMHLALDQEHEQHMQQFGVPEALGRHQAMSSFSLPASPRHRSRPHTADAMMHTRRSTSPDPKVKKSSGFGKLWKFVRSKKSEGRHQTASFLSAPQDDDVSMPLPPPPKMSYLANQRSPSSPHSRQLSTPGSPNGVLAPSSHPRSISQPGPYSTGAISPTTAASSTLPSPTSNRFAWRESAGDDRRHSTFKDANGTYKDLNGDAETEHVVPDSESNIPMQYNEVNGGRAPRTAGSASSEYGRMLQPSNNAPLTRSPAQSTMVSSSAHSPRPVSSVHKPLPPPPPSEPMMRHMSASATMPYNTTRPNTIMNTNDTFLPPGPLRNDDAYDSRRQSFGGMTTRPDLLPPGAAQSLQTKRSIPAMPYADNPSTYQEFGDPYEQGYMAAPYSNGALSDGNKSKRRSRFMLPFLSKKEKEKPVFAPQHTNGDPMRYSTYGAPPSQFLPPTRAPFDHSQRSRSSASLTTPDYAPGINVAAHYSQPFGFSDGGRPMSGISTFTNGQRPNKSLIDEVVPRDNDFLAYRYPSPEQTLDTNRR